MKRIVVIGGSDAGISAALRIRELTIEFGVTILLADTYPNFSICGLPFFLSGEVADWRNLAHRTQADIEKKRITILMGHRVTAINTESKTLSAIDQEGGHKELGYDKLIIGTGAVSSRPPIDGINLDGVFSLRWMEDSFRLKQYLGEKKPKSVTIVGGGYIGLEMADAFFLRGLQVTLVECFPTVLTTVHESFGRQVQQELERKGVKVYTGTGIDTIREADDGLRLTGPNGFSCTSDLILVAAGAKPATEVAAAAGIDLDGHGAIKVNNAMETNVADIYAAGDCVATWHQLLQTFVYMPLGTTAHKQGRIAGENAIGRKRQFAGSLGTQVVKVFDLAVARTGLRADEAGEAGYAPLTVAFLTWDHKVYYPNAHPMHLRITADRTSNQLLGAQIIGHFQGEVAKRIDILATAIYHRMSVEQLSDLDLSYTPPLSSPWDPVQMAAQAWQKEARRLQGR